MGDGLHSEPSASRNVTSLANSAAPPTTITTFSRSEYTYIIEAVLRWRPGRACSQSVSSVALSEERS